MTMFKKLSFSHVYEPVAIPNCIDKYNEKQSVLKTTSVDFEGRPVTKSEFVVDDPVKRYDGLKASDFLLENQLSVGHELSPCKYAPSYQSIEARVESANSFVPQPKPQLNVEEKS